MAALPGSLGAKQGRAPFPWRRSRRPQPLGGLCPRAACRERMRTGDVRLQKAVAGRLGGRKLRSGGFEPSPAAGQVLWEEPQPTGEEDVGWRRRSVFQPRSFPPAGQGWLPTRCCRAQTPGVEQRMPRRVGWHWPSPRGPSAAAPPSAPAPGPDASPGRPQGTAGWRRGAWAPQKGFAGKSEGQGGAALGRRPGLAGRRYLAGTAQVQRQLDNWLGGSAAKMPSLSVGGSNFES